MPNFKTLRQQIIPVIGFFEWTKIKVVAHILTIFCCCTELENGIVYNNYKVIDPNNSY